MPKTFICLCEDITETEIRQAVRAGHGDLESLKRYLAAGTGACQAKMCVAGMLRIIEEETQMSPEGAKPLVSRPPLSMTPLNFFAGDDDKEQKP